MHSPTLRQHVALSLSFTHPSLLPTPTPFLFLLFILPFYAFTYFMAACSPFFVLYPPSPHSFQPPWTSFLFLLFILPFYAFTYFMAACSPFFVLYPPSPHSFQPPPLFYFFYSSSHSMHSPTLKGNSSEKLPPTFIAPNHSPNST